MSAVIYARYKNEPIEAMLSRFKRLLKNENIFIDMRKHDYFIRPGELRRQKRRRKKTISGEEIT